MVISAQESIDKLRHLLEKQIEAVRKGDFSCFDELAGQSDAAMSEIAQIDVSERRKSAEQFKSLMDLYKKLELMLSAAKDTVGKQMNQIGQSRKTMQVYKNNE